LKLKAGIIGLGVGEQHIYGYNSHPDVEVVSLCDFDAQKLADVKTRHPNLNYTQNADEILEDKNIDIVSIASFDNFHTEQICKGIKNRKHIFAEKPVCLHFHEAQEIRKTLNNHPNTKLSSNLILRLSPRFIELKKSIENKELGTIQYVEADYHYGRLHKITQGWRNELDFYSIIHGGGVHVIDLLRWLTNDEIVKVSAVGANTSKNVTNFKYNDVVTSILEFKSGLIGKIGVNFSCMKPHSHKLSVFGDLATFENDVPNARLYSSRDPKTEYHEIKTAYPGVSKGDLITSFIDSIIYDSTPIVDCEDVFKTMAVCFAIEKSSKTFESVIVQNI